MARKQLDSSEYSRDNVERYRKQASRKGVRKSLLVGIVAALVILLGGTAFAAVRWYNSINSRLQGTTVDDEELQAVLSEPTTPSDPYYILLLGTDGRAGEEDFRADTIILTRVDPVNKRLTMLSIPRDTRVELDGYGIQKINAAYAFEGAGGAVRAVSELCDVGVNHVAVVHLDELAGLVDYLGGVTVNVSESIYDPEHTGVSLEAGLQTLTGEQAVAWARTRYGYATGDFHRQENQRVLLEAIMNRMLSLSPRQIPGALEHVGDLIGTDLRCYDLVPLFLRFKLVGPQVYSASVPSTTATIDGVSYVIADDAALADMMRIINAGGDPSTSGY